MANLWDSNRFSILLYRLVFSLLIQYLSVSSGRISAGTSLSQPQILAGLYAGFCEDRTYGARMRFAIRPPVDGLPHGTEEGTNQRDHPVFRLPGYSGDLLAFKRRKFGRGFFPKIGDQIDHLSSPIGATPNLIMPAIALKCGNRTGGIFRYLGSSFA